MNGDNPISELSYEELERARDLGAATYLSAYLHLMMRQLKIDGHRKEEVNELAAKMVDTLNLSTQIAFCALMSDPDGVYKGLEELKITVEKLLEQNRVE